MARGLFKKIMEKTGITDRFELQRRLMKVATEAAKAILKEALGPEGASKPGSAWFEALKIVLPVFWEVVKKKEDIPTVEEVVAAVKAAVPNYAERLRAVYAKATA